MSSDPNVIKLIDFLKEQRPYPWVKENLPLMPEVCPVVTMTKEQVTRFRNKYVFLLNFAAFVLNKDTERICAADLYKYLIECGALYDPKNAGMFDLRPEDGGL